MFRRKKDAFKFSGRKHSIKGMISSILGGLSCIAILTLSYVSSLTAGNGSIIIGVIGMVLFVISIVGFVLGIKACKEKEIYYTTPIIGLVINGFLSIVYFTLYMVGISL
jgi:hypothetical protein